MVKHHWWLSSSLPAYSRTTKHFRAETFKIVDIEINAWSSLFLICGLIKSYISILKFLKMQPIRVSISEPKQPIRSRDIFSAINEKTLNGGNPLQEYRKQRNKQKMKSVHSGYRDYGYPIQEFSLSTPF